LAGHEAAGRSEEVLRGSGELIGITNALQWMALRSTRSSGVIREQCACERRVGE
jgi:hypothetical protein